jgi:Outer membrane receptor proteins, mostly Fe transport
MQFGSGQLSFEMDSLNMFTLSYNRRYGLPKSTTSALTDNYDGNMNSLFSYNQESTQKQTWGSNDVGLDYQHMFKRKGELLTLSYKWSNTPNNSNYDATNTINPLYHSVPQFGLAQSSTSKNDAKSNEHTFQVDYNRPLAKGHTLELGAKYIMRLNDSKANEKYSYFNMQQPYPYTPYIVADSISKFNNDQDILGAYASYAGNIGKWGFKGGVRYEYTWLKAEFDKTAENFSTNYGVVVPSAIVTYKLSDMQSLKLGYNMRIQRPSISYLNPYVDRKDPNYISHGNPNLDPEKSHNITLGYSNFAPKYNVSAELTYTFVNNAIEQYSLMNPDPSAQVEEQTYGNVGHNKQLNLNLFGNYRAIKWLTLFANGSVSYVNMKSTTLNISNDGYTGRIYGGGTVILPKDMRLSVGGGGMLPQINLQGSQSAFYYSFFSISKDLLQKRFNISMSSVWLPKTHITMDTEGINSKDHTKSFNQHTDIRIGQPLEFRFNVSYRIGSMNTQVKKTRATISNDDQKAKESSSAGQNPMQ